MSKKGFAIAPSDKIASRIAQDAAGVEKDRYDPDVEYPHARQNRSCQKKNLSVDKERKGKNRLDIGPSQKNQIRKMSVLFEKEEKMVHALPDNLVSFSLFY